MNKMEGKVIITDEHIMKVAHISDGLMIGYDVITEELVSLPLTSKWINAPNSILALLKEERARFNYVNAVFPNLSNEKKSAMMAVSDRTFYRLQK